jgi:hypothetical protein
MKFYFQTMKKNIFLCLMTLMILILTSGFWYGIPSFGLTEFFFEMNVPRFVLFVLICLSVGFCFSIICIPLHLSFAKEYSRNKKKNMISTFLITQGILIIFVAFLFGVFYLTVSLNL